MNNSDTSDFLNPFAHTATHRISETPLKGVVLSFGMATGKAQFFKVPPAKEYIPAGEINIDEEKSKIKEGLQRLRNNISQIVSEIAVMLTEESLEVFDVYRLLAQDSFFEKELLDIVESGRTAFDATEALALKFKKQMRQNEFWKTRLYDMQYLLRQLRNFLNKDAPPTSPSFPYDKTPMILIAPYISPADLLYCYRYRKVVGLVLKDQSQTSHAAIVARSLHIPTLGGIHLTPKICPPYAQLLIDTHGETLYIAPSPSTLQQLQRRTVSAAVNADDMPTQTITKDNIKIDLLINANLDSDLKALHHPIVNGVGLFRTEILFMLPGVVADFYAQVDEYKRIFNKSGGKPIIFRTIDTADDKELAVATNDTSEKRLPDEQWAPIKETAELSKHLVLASSMGRALLDKHQFLRTQIKALLRARIQSDEPYAPIYIMIPMISDAVELKAYQKLIEAEAMQESRGHPSLMSQIKIGVMIEVPALVYQIDRIQNLVDFASIGTNDLFHFFFATNRWDTQGKRAQDILSPAFLRFIGNIIHQLVQLNIPVHVCGEMAATPLAAMALLGIGVRKLSIAPSAVRATANMINSLPLGLLLPYTSAFRVESYEFSICSAAQYENSANVYHTLQKFAHEYSVQV
ncbi:MAG: hypothetical protein LBR89_02330 [Holosporales bacterium]|jgi:phosphotransferase system enzyme I (PtsP)|nr:hypothetical protein [Holosporales bacterium]